jgi:hypothetical protein
MPYVVEVDQSIKVEAPGDTFLAFSDGISYAIKVPFSVKQRGLQALRNRGKTKKRAKLLLFAACVFLLLESHLEQLQRVTVDNEYDGRQDDIKSFLLEYIRRKDPSFESERIDIRAIGKKSPADELAGAVRRGKREADRTITAEELLSVVG